MTDLERSRDSIIHKRLDQSHDQSLLIFHLTESLIANVKSTLEAIQISESIRMKEAIQNNEDLKKIEILKNESIAKLLEASELGLKTPLNKVPQSVSSILETPKEEAKSPKFTRVLDNKKKSHFNDSDFFEKKQVEEELVNEAVPFLSLNLKNAPDVYKIGKSYLRDIVKKNKNFGFSTLSEVGNELNLLAFGSFINYSLNQPVLIIVQDLNSKVWNQYRQNFSSGTLWKWQTYDWGNLCFIDYHQINRRIEEFNLLNLDLVTEDFAAVLWSLPHGNLQEKLPQISLTVIRQLSSVTLTVKSGETTAKSLKVTEAYYQCFDVPVKGILQEGLR